MSTCYLRCAGDECSCLQEYFEWVERRRFGFSGSRMCPGRVPKGLGAEHVSLLSYDLPRMHSTQYGIILIVRGNSQHFTLNFCSVLQRSTVYCTMGSDLCAECWCGNGGVGDV